MRPKARRFGLALFTHYRAYDFGAMAALQESETSTANVNAMLAVLDESRKWFEAYCRELGVDPDAHLAELILDADSSSDGGGRLV
jgi:hypothetical protein